MPLWVTRVFLRQKVLREGIKLCETLRRVEMENIDLFSVRWILKGDFFFFFLVLDKDFSLLLTGTFALRGGLN